MYFWASAEVYQLAYKALNNVRRCVEPFLNEAAATSSLASLDCKLRYVPIVMPEAMLARYPARSKLRKKERLYDCSPILNYQVFVDGTFEDQVREYLRGIAETTPHLAALGADEEQIAEFQRILQDTYDRAMTLRPDWTRH